MMRTLHNTFWAAVFVVALGAPAARAQQQQAPDQQQQTPDQGNAPIPAYRSPLASASGNDDSDAEQSTPDNRSLSGAQDLSPMMLPTRSFWQPQINVYGTVESNPSGSPNNSTWTAGSTVSGHIDIHRVSGNSDLSLTYTAGGVFLGNGGVGNGIVQAVAFGDKFSFRRAQVSFFDDLNYLPGSSFGFGALGGLAGTPLPGNGSTGLGSVFGPGQTILTEQGQNLGNSFVTEVDINLTPRSSVTLVGGYGLLHDFSSVLLNSTNPNFRAGYNHQMTLKDSIAVFYTFSSYRYSNSDQSFDTHTAQFSYGRLVSGKVAFQIAAGPQFVVARIPLSVSGGSSGTIPSTTTNQLNWSVNTTLTWTGRRNSLGLGYYRGANNGSGILAGSIGDTVSASLTRAASRTFSSGIVGGYSRNQGVSVGTTTISNQSFDSLYGSASLSHPLGRTLGLTLSYTVQYQVPHFAVCGGTGPACGTSSITNLIAFGVGWHERPLLF
ncbi:MAG TPA: hypothetical protein VNV41_05710 [Candidatus Acidoferrales bacterium]|jgi:hypothetical protein|nr:hypothetical protein [Candidatus Acidoferrales bacterium]